MVRSLLLAYGADESLTATLIQLAREANQRGWWHQYGGAIPDWFEIYVGLEDEATELRLFQIQLVPGLLQAEPYAREVNKAEDPRRSDDEVERRVKLRTARQEILHRNRPPKVWAVIDEAALHRQIGGSIVMRAQYNGQGDCVEVAENADIVGVRDSKDRTGPMLVLGHAGWRAFLAAVKDGEFDL